jgi:hypothetical protein
VWRKGVRASLGVANLGDSVFPLASCLSGAQGGADGSEFYRLLVGASQLGQRRVYPSVLVCSGSGRNLRSRSSHARRVTCDAREKVREGVGGIPVLASVATCLETQPLNKLNMSCATR